MIPVFTIHRFNLANGLKVILVPDNRLPVMSQYTFYKVGSRNESTSITGISHLFEHMMFKGSKKFGPGEFDAILESHGGYSNAYTTRDMTVYYESFPPRILATAMELNADRMGWLNLNPVSLESEREVVKEERRMRTDNSIPGILDELLHATAYIAHSYRWPVIGWMDDLNYITLQDCQNYFAEFYSPNNAVLLIVGDCKVDDVTRMVERYYGSIPSHALSIPRFTSEPPQQGERRTRQYKNTQVESCMIGFHVPGVNNPDNFPLDILQTILGEGESSRFYNLLVYEKELVVAINVEYEWCFDPYLFVFYAKLKPGKKVEEVESVIYSELENIAHNGIKAEELQKAKTILLSSVIRGMKTASGKGNRLGIIEMLLNDCQKLYELPAEYNNVTEQDIQSIIRKYLNEKNRTVVSVLPEK